MPVGLLKPGHDPRRRVRVGTAIGDRTVDLTHDQIRALD
jgi:hypothetical protein